MSVGSEITDEDQQVLELLRTPGLSIKYLDEANKERIRSFIRRNHIERGISLVDLAKLIGNKTSGYTSWLTRQLGIQPRPFEEARLRAIKEKRRKYERRPFDGTLEDRAYLIGLKHGDLSVTQPWPNATTAIRVSTSTTHPAMAELFTNLFSPYGHVSKHPRFKKDTQSYEWNFNAVLDRSFKFLREEKASVWKWVAGEDCTSLAYIAGVFDAEGSISISNLNGSAFLMMNYYNTDIQLLNNIKGILQRLGFNPVGPYLDKPKGSKSSKYGIRHNKDYWHLQLSRFGECQSLLARLPIRHEEKVRKSHLIMPLADNSNASALMEKVEALRNSIHQARDSFVQEAETLFKSTHPELPVDRFLDLMQKLKELEIQG